MFEKVLKYFFILRFLFFVLFVEFFLLCNIFIVFGDEGMSIFGDIILLFSVD